MRHEQLRKPETFDIVEPKVEVEVPRASARSEAAVPDVPAAVGVMMVGVYVLIVALFALTIASAGAGPFMIGVDLVFLAAFFTVPMLILKQERDPKWRPGMSRFLSQGMQTYTGHVTGGGALVQMFIVPVLLAFGVLCIGIIVMAGA